MSKQSKLPNPLDSTMRSIMSFYSSETFRTVLSSGLKSTMAEVPKAIIMPDKNVLNDAILSAFEDIADSVKASSLEVVEIAKELFVSLAQYPGDAELEVPSDFFDVTEPVIQFASENPQQFDSEIDSEMSTVSNLIHLKPKRLSVGTIQFILNILLTILLFLIQTGMDAASDAEQAKRDAEIIRIEQEELERTKHIEDMLEDDITLREEEIALLQSINDSIHILTDAIENTPDTPDSPPQPENANTENNHENEGADTE